MTVRNAKHEKTRRLAMAVLAASLLCAGCGTPKGDQSPAPRGPARRVISLVPAVTEMLFAIGAGPQVIAVSSFDHYPPQVEHLPRVGALLDPDIERILSMRPDVVALFEGQDDLRAKLSAAHIEVLAYRRARPGQSQLADIAAQALELGRLTGHEREARQVADRLEEQLAEIGNRASREQAGMQAPKVMLVVGREPGTLRNIYASGAVGFLADMLNLLHVRNAFGDVPRESLQVTTEAILAAQPDVIVEVVASRPWSAGDLAREEHVWEELSSLPAVRSHRVHLLVGDEFVIPGPRVLDAARKLAAAVESR